LTSACYFPYKTDCNLVSLIRIRGCWQQIKKLPGGYGREIANIWGVVKIWRISFIFTKFFKQMLYPSISQGLWLHTDKANASIRKEFGLPRSKALK